MAEDAVQTAHGVLRIAPPAAEGAPHRVTLDGRLLFEDAGHRSVSLAGAYPASGPTVLLLALDTGGSARPREYQVLELRGDGGVRRSAVFGTGSDMVRVREEEGGLRVSLPRRCHWEPAVWVYRDGQLAEVTPPAPRDAASRARATAFGRVEVAAGPAEYQAQLTLEGLALYAEDPFRDLHIADAFPAARPRLLLLEIRVQGGAAAGPCPQYRLVELRPGGRFRRTEAFGDGLWPAGARYRGGALELDMAGRDGGVEESWVYRGGRLTPRPTPSPGPPGGPRRPRSRR